MEDLQRSIKSEKLAAWGAKSLSDSKGNTDHLSLYIPGQWGYHPNLEFNYPETWEYYHCITYLRFKGLP